MIVPSRAAGVRGPHGSTERVEEWILGRDARSARHWSLSALLGAARRPRSAAGVGVTSISSLPAGAKAGNLSGLVTNDTGSAAKAVVTVRVMRRGTGGALIGRTSVNVAAHGSKSFLVGVKLPASLKKGTYYVAACTPQGGADKGALGCATSAADLKIKGGDPLRGQLATKAFDTQNGAATGKAHAAQAPACTPGARTLVRAGQPRLAGARQRRLQVAPHRRLHRLRRGHEQVPAGHPRRAHAAGRRSA